MSECTPAMIFISVDLPAPFSPTNPWISPGNSAKSTSRSAVDTTECLGDPGKLEQWRRHERIK